MNENSRSEKKIDSTQAWAYVVADSARYVRLVGVFVAVAFGVSSYISLPQQLSSESEERKHQIEEIRKLCIQDKKFLESRIDHHDKWIHSHESEHVKLFEKTEFHEKRIDQCCPFYRGGR